MIVSVAAGISITFWTGFAMYELALSVWIAYRALSQTPAAAVEPARVSPDFA